MDDLCRLHQTLSRLIAAVKLDHKGFWGCRQEFKKRVQIQTSGLLKVAEGKYNSREHPGSPQVHGQILRAGHRMTRPGRENPLYFG
jgi:hypothetical protein